MQRRDKRGSARSPASLTPASLFLIADQPVLDGWAAPRGLPLNRHTTPLQEPTRDSYRTPAVVRLYCRAL